MRNGQNLIQRWYLDTSVGVFLAVTNTHKLLVPVLEFEAFGKDGNYNKPFTYELMYFDDTNPHGAVHISRNKVPECVKRTFREFIRSGAKKRAGMKQAEVGV